MAEYDIYLISSADYWYVGSTTRGAMVRYGEHRGGHGNAPRLWAKMQEIGVDAFDLQVLDSGTGDPIAAEAEWYERLQATEPRECLNGKTPSGWDGCGGFEGHAHTEESKARIGAAAKRKMTPEARASLSEQMQGNQYARGNVMSDEHRKKISATHKGKPKSAQQRANMSAAQKARYAREKESIRG